MPKCIVKHSLPAVWPHLHMPTLYPSERLSPVVVSTVSGWNWFHAIYQHLRLICVALHRESEPVSHSQPPDTCHTTTRWLDGILIEVFSIHFPAILRALISSLSLCFRSFSFICSLFTMDQLLPNQHVINIYLFHHSKKLTLIFPEIHLYFILLLFDFAIMSAAFFFTCDVRTYTC